MRPEQPHRGPAVLAAVAVLLGGTSCAASAPTAATTTSSAHPGAAPSLAARTATATPRPTPPPTPTVPAPSPVATVAPPPAPLPPWPSRRQVAGMTCEQVLLAVNGAAARCVDPGDRRLQTQAVGTDTTVALTDDDQVVYVQRGLSPDDTYLVAMHERGHQELRQRCATWSCGDLLVRALGSTRQAWTEGPYFARVVEQAASAWARCHGADNARYGSRLGCAQLERAFAAESAVRRTHARQQAAYDDAWARYRRARQAYDRRVADPVTPAARP